MSKCISHTKLTPTLSLTERKDGFWLYDETRGMNLAMRAKTPQDAFVEALSYYQKRLQYTEKAHADLRSQVVTFVAQFIPEAED